MLFLLQYCRSEFYPSNPGEKPTKNMETLMPPELIHVHDTESQVVDIPPDLAELIQATQPCKVHIPLAQPMQDTESQGVCTPVTELIDDTQLCEVHTPLVLAELIKGTQPCEVHTPIAELVQDTESTKGHIPQAELTQGTESQETMLLN